MSVFIPRQVVFVLCLVLPCWIKKRICQLYLFIADVNDM